MVPTQVRNIKNTRVSTCWPRLLKSLNLWGMGGKGLDRKKEHRGSLRRGAAPKEWRRDTRSAPGAQEAEGRENLPCPSADFGRAPCAIMMGQMSQRGAGAEPEWQGKARELSAGFETAVEVAEKRSQCSQKHPGFEEMTGREQLVHVAGDKVGLNSLEQFALLNSCALSPH